MTVVLHNTNHFLYSLPEIVSQIKRKQNSETKQYQQPANVAKHTENRLIITYHFQLDYFPQKKDKQISKLYYNQKAYFFPVHLSYLITE